MNKFFGEVKKNFGFGCMRLPMCGEEIDFAQVCKMADCFFESGFNYIDTAHGYLSEKSEIAVRECIAKRYPRDKFVLTNKLTGNYFKTNGDIRPFFEKQLQACGVDYFDFYLMHAQNEDFFKHFKECRAYETALQFKEEGKIKHFGISFHDKAEVLDKILTEYPQVEVVQIQFNYLDSDDVVIQGEQCRQVCLKHKKPVIVMEPVKGGTLANLPPKAKEIADGANCASPASLALRYAASFDGIFMVLSGMSDIRQMKENINIMQDIKPLSQSEADAVQAIKKVFRDMDAIPCTACRYCTDGCPKKISIPDLFADMNAKKQYKNWNSDFYYMVHTQNNGRASDCVACGKCEKVCPQRLPIRNLLKDVAKIFDKEK